MQDFKRSVLSNRFLLAVLGSTILYLISVYDLGLKDAIRWGDKRHLLDYLGDAQTVTLMSLLPFAAVLPYGAGFAEDWEFHGYYYQISRTSSGRYRLSKILAAMLSGGLVMVLSMLVFLLIILPFAELNPAAVSTHFSYMETIVNKGQWGRYFSFQLALSFPFGMLWACASMLLSTFTTSRSMIYAVPMILNAVLNRVAFLLHFPGLYAVSFGMVDAHSPIGAFITCSAILAVPIIIFSFLFMHQSKRRLIDA